MKGKSNSDEAQNCIGGSCPLGVHSVAISYVHIFLCYLEPLLTLFCIKCAVEMY